MTPPPQSETDQDVAPEGAPIVRIGGSQPSAPPAAPMDEDTSSDGSRGWLGRRRNDQIRELKDHIAELERTIEDLRSRKELADLDEVELTELASQTAVTMVRAAKERQEQVSAEADALLEETRVAAIETTETSRKEAQRLRQEAEAEAKDTIAEAKESAEVIALDNEASRLLELEPPPSDPEPVIAGAVAEDATPTEADEPTV